MDTADTAHIYDVSKQKPTPKRQPRHHQKFENTKTPIAQATQSSIYTNHEVSCQYHREQNTPLRFTITLKLPTEAEICILGHHLY